MAKSLFSENLEETFALQEAELENEWVAGSRATSSDS
jgi:hypothetical protein